MHEREAEAGVQSVATVVAEAAQYMDPTMLSNAASKMRAMDTEVHSSDVSTDSGHP